MENSDDIYDNIRDMINHIPDNFKILEETIDIEVQKAYFETAKDIVIDPEQDVLPEMIIALESGHNSIEEVKTILQKMALLDSVEAYRAIERYSQQSPAELKEWSILALQQSKMVLHCSLLDEQQVFISTGLGGKHDKLRYLLIFPFNKVTLPISQFQKDSLEKELLFFLSKSEGELEEIDFEPMYSTAMILVPLKIPVSEIVKEVLMECNQFGNFLSDNAMVTNMKRFTRDEIGEMIAEQDEE